MISITELFQDSKELLDKITYFVDKHIGCKLLRKCGIRKLVDQVKEEGILEYADNPILRFFGHEPVKAIVETCVSAKQLLIDKIMLSFSTASAYWMFQNDSFYGNYKKDTFYRFDLLPKANWERLQTETAKSVISEIVSATDHKHVQALIFDDSLYARTGGKGTELCGKVYDHNDHKLRIGYRMMTGCWTNGETVVPFSQSLLTTRDEQLMLGPDVPTDKRTLRGKRRARAKSKGTDVMCSMVKEAQKAGIPFDYVLFDTWFSNPAQLVQLKKADVDVIAMIKKNSTKYTYTDSETGKTSKLDVKEIYARNKKRRGRSCYLLSVEVMVTDQTGKSIAARLVYARNRNKRKDWVCFVCTDTSLSEEQILRIYTMRWKIETYFKISKSYLKLRTECHSTSYDAITAHMVIVALRYMILEMLRFWNDDMRTLEDLFRGIQREVIDDMMDQAVCFLLDALFECVWRYFAASEKQMSQLATLFIESLPANWRCRFVLPQSA